MKLTLNENIRKHRKSFSLTQEQLAEAMGVTVGAVSKWESGMSNPDINMLPVLADFFEISVDVLLGYQPTTRTTELAAGKIRELLLKKNYEEGQAEAEKALQRFPNCFDVVYQSAILYSMKGVEKGDQAALHKSINLFQHACGLISQNTDPSISELSLQTSIGELYVSLGDSERALEHLRKYNACGINNSMIGCILSQLKRHEEALPYFSQTVLDSVLNVFRTVIGLSDYYSHHGNYELAIDILSWMNETICGLKYPDQVCYMDRAQVVLFLSCAQAAADMNDADKAEEYLSQAIDAARRFDKDPSFDALHIRFYHGKPQTIGDDFGETALSGLKKAFMLRENINPILNTLWRKLIDEENK
ncbi:helix-turn-helix domain-containing protein [Kineothrix sp. MB12-C1]|uniref:helix-turn-helix domain-containing protein n=1 Tax=Kineothrix sp. MB12-C1 TaxID=3070215 RepID=UPI0027D221E9|nr:helix-turn-helix domain-containing protein [Kineothrix sp. MB12-C1]WMC91469.1 helix-turn-helix domain-containing protein [Kineothrix sp. MB12-C1]